MQKWKDLKSKGGKSQRIWRTTVDYELRKPIEKLLSDYRKQKNVELLEKARNYLIEHKSNFSVEHQKRIDYWLS